MEQKRIAVFAGNVLAIVGVALLIEVTGGLPSQLAHLYYLPVVLAALFLPMRHSIVVALLAGLAVSPASDLVRQLTGSDLYYEDIAPWNFTPEGWIIRPLAFLGISLLGGNVLREREAKTAAQATSSSHRGELTVLSRIDRMILRGATEQDALREIAHLVGKAMGVHQAAVVLPGDETGRMRMVVGPDASPELVATAKQGLPAGEGVSGWALLHGKTATSRNVDADPRYDEMKTAVHRTNSRSTAAAPIILDGEILAAIGISYDHEHDFTLEELATLERIADQAAIAVANARQRESLRRLSFETAIGLSEAIESRDPYTGDHCSRLAGYAAHLGKAFGLDRRENDVLRLGAALHDIGKIVVPDEILKKPDTLTPAEFAIIKQHCYQGGQICKRVTALREAYPIVYHHHERWDGRGYPDGLKGDRIPFGARIVAAVDAYDAMTSDRPYRTAMEDEEARAILRDGSGSQWDPAVIEKLLAIDLAADAEHRYLRPAA